MSVGCALGALMIFDFLVLLTLGLIAAPLVIGNAATGRMQGVATFLIALTILSMAVLAIGITAALLWFMVMALLALLPYVFVFAAGFPSAEAAGLLGLAMALKTGFAFALLVSHPKFLENTGLVMIVATSLGLGALVGVLHAVPSFFVSLADAIGGLVILCIAALRASGFVVGALPAVKKAIGV